MRRMIRGGRIVSEIDTYESDILVEDGRIAAIGRGMAPPSDCEVYEATGKRVLPGAIDAHVHVSLDLNGRVSSDFRSTTREAALGGVTTILTYVTPRSGQTLEEAVDERIDQAEGQCHIDYGLHAALVNWNEREADEIPRMIDAGIPSFKAYTVYSSAGLRIDDEELYSALLNVGQHGGLLEVHCENEWMIERRAKRLVQEGRLRPVDHAASRPSYVESEAVASVLRLAYDAGVPVYIVHVSAGESVEAIDEAIELGVEVYAETCPHFMLLDASSLEMPDGQRYATCPPLRESKHQRPLWDALEDGLIQVIATDHCAFLASDKDEGADDFRKIPMGLPGVGTLLPLMWHYGVGSGRMRENDLVERLCTQPAEIFGLYPRKGTIAPGSDADLVILDPELNATITPERVGGHSDYSPYAGWEVRGWPVSTMLRGEWVVKDRELVGSHELGSFVRRGKVCQRPGNR